MVRRLCILCFLLALSPGLALAQSAALMDAFNQSQALYEQGRYAEAEPFARKALELGQQEFGPNHPNTGSFLNNLAELNRGRRGDVRRFGALRRHGGFGRRGDFRFGALRRHGGFGRRCDVRRLGGFRCR